MNGAREFPVSPGCLTAGARPYTNPYTPPFLFEIRTDPPSQGHEVCRLTLPQRKMAVVGFMYAKPLDV